ncbi:MAG: hypothetical protein WAL72_35685 [Streptosporangiaceae bacterium]
MDFVIFMIGGLADLVLARHDASGTWVAGTMNHMPAVRRFAAGNAPAAAAIIRGLPDYFTDDVPAKVERDAASHQAWVLTDSGAVAGIAVAARKSPDGAEICGSPSTLRRGRPREPGDHVPVGRGWRQRDDLPVIEGDGLARQRNGGTGHSGKATALP